MRTGPSLTELNNRMILFEYERALRKGDERLAFRIREANPQVNWIVGREFVLGQDQWRREGR